MKKIFYTIVLIIPSFVCSMESPNQIIKLSPRTSTGTPLKVDSKKALQPVTKGRRLTDSDPNGVGFISQNSPKAEHPMYNRVRSQSQESVKFVQGEGLLYKQPYEQQRKSFEAENKK